MLLHSKSHFIASYFSAKMIDDAELWGTDKQATEKAKRARNNTKRHAKNARLPPRHKKSKASGSHSAMPPLRSEAGGSQGTEHLSDMIQEEEASVPHWVFTDQIGVSMKRTIVARPGWLHNPGPSDSS